MLRNYCKIALRNLWKHKSFTVINIVGLAVAFGATLLLSLTAFHELSFDHFHEHKTRFTRYTWRRIARGYGEQHRADPFCPGPTAEFPDLAHVSRFGSSGVSILRYKDHEF